MSERKLLMKLEGETPRADADEARTVHKLDY